MLLHLSLIINTTDNNEGSNGALTMYAYNNE